MLAATMPSPIELRSAVGRVNDDEEALAQAFLDGDPQAFGEWVKRNERLVYRLVRRYTRTPEEARDLAQKVFLKAFESARPSLLAWRGPRPKAGSASAGLTAWVVRVAVNTGKNHRRDSSRWGWAPVEAVDQKVQSGIGPQRALEVREDRERMRAAVADLPRRQREVFSLRVDGELPFARIAKVLGITENNAKVTFHHAVRRLEQLVKEGAQ